MDKAGRVVLPRVIRERLGLIGPAQLELVDSPDGVVLRPVGADVPYTRDASGWVVFHSDGPESAAESIDPVAAVDAERERRTRRSTQ
jgi:AbrB family looped-hinge helix DNA binding protein